MEFYNAFRDVFLESAPYLLLGFLIAGLLKSMFKDSFIQKHMGEPSTRSVVNAALIGIPLPLCSCGVIPATISLKDKGASKGASMSFLISTPQSGVDSLSISYGLLGPIITLFRPLSGFLAAFFSGILENFIKDDFEDKKYEPIKSCCDPVEEKIEEVNSCCSSDDSEMNHHEEKLDDTSTTKKVYSGLKYAFGDLSNDIAFHLLIGFMLAALISTLLPESFFQTYMNNEFLSLFAMLVIGIPMYICATASTPVAAAMLLKGLSPGAALVFLLAGPATNIASIVVLQDKFGKKAIIRMISVIILTALSMGYILNLLVGYIDLQIPIQELIGIHSDHYSLLSVLSSLILIVLIVKGIWVENLKKYLIKN